MMKSYICKSLVILLLSTSFISIESVFAEEQQSVQPVEISAKDSLEWDKKEQRYTAYKDVIITQGNITIRCNKLSAYYKSENELTNVSLLEASDNIVISSPPYNAYGDKATYDVITGKAVLTGNNVSVATEKDVMTSTNKIEFFRDNKKIVAYGRPIIKHDKDIISSDIMEAYFKQGSDGKMISDKMVASGNVAIETQDEVIKGDKLVFNSQTRQAVMIGNVSIKKGESYLSGSKAVVDMNTGISQLLGDEPGSKSEGRVKGVFFPKGKSN